MQMAINVRAYSIISVWVFTFLFGYCHSQQVDLSRGFTSGSTELQASFAGDASEGFPDGAQLSQQGTFSLLPVCPCLATQTDDAWLETSSVPVFALGDSSGVNTAASFTIMMIDTTSQNERTLHFLCTGYKASGEKTQLQSSVDPLLAYQAPGSFGETGTRKYIFLLYTEPRNLRVRNLPGEGEPFDLGRFQGENNLKDPRAGITFVVDIGSSDNSPQPSVPASSQNPPATTTERTSVTPGTTQLAPTSAVADLDPPSTELISTLVPAPDTTSQPPADPTSIAQAPDASESQSTPPFTRTTPASSPAATTEVPTSGALVDQLTASGTTFELATTSATRTAGSAASSGASTGPSPALQSDNAASYLKTVGPGWILPAVLFGFCGYL